MIAHEAASGADPRRRMSVDAATLRAQPEVARPAKASDGVAMVVGVLGALGLGVLTLVGLSNGRAAPPPAVAARAAPIESIVVPVSTTAPRRIASAGSVATQTPAAVDPGQSRAMPMIIDNTALAVGTTAATDAATAPHGIAGASPMQPNGLSQDEMFAMRIGSDAPPVAYASGLGNPDRTVVQGTIIPAVLETALNSDLPGFVRAIVSRDVRSFDGSWVAVPRGSRLVGQYKSGLATGQSRAYIIWTRLIRPDGISVQLASPVMDEGSEVGLPGEVKRHFWQRFGSSILLSVVSGLASSFGDGDSDALVIGTSGTQSASALALETDGKIPPTIRVPLGTPIQVFAARDLDFSGQPLVPVSIPENQP